MSLFEIEDIRQRVRDGIHQVRDIESISGIAIHRVGVNGKTGAVLGYDALSICDAFTGRDPKWPDVSKATNGQNAYTFFVGGDFGPDKYDGKIWQALDLTEIGWHARSHSKTWIGIGLIGDFRTLAPSRDQMTACIALVSRLCAALKLTRFMVKGHGELAGAHDGSKGPGAPGACPGDHIDMDEVRIKIGTAISLGCSESARKDLETAGAVFA